MSWRITDHPEGGLQVSHEATPRFTARWTTGAFPLDLVRDGCFFWTDEASGEEDAVHLFTFNWGDPAPTGNAFKRLMQAAALAIEHYVTGGA